MKQKLLKLWWVFPTVIFLGIPLATLLFPCRFPGPVYSIDNGLVLICFVLLIPFFGLAIGALRPIDPNLGRHLLVSIASFGVFLLLATDLGILLSGHHLWIRMAEREASPRKLQCYSRAVLNSTPYGCNIFENIVLERVPAGRRAAMFEAAAQAAPWPGWKERFQAQAIRAGRSTMDTTALEKTRP